MHLAARGRRRREREVSAPERRIHRVGVRLKPEERQELAREYESGRSSEDLAVTHGLSKHAVLDVLHAEAIHVRHQSLTVNEADECATLYESGLTIREVAAAMDVPKTTVQNVLRRRGVAMRPAEGLRSRGLAFLRIPDLHAAGCPWSVSR